MYSNVDYVMDFTNFSEYDTYVEANFDAESKQAYKLTEAKLGKRPKGSKAASWDAAYEMLNRDLHKKSGREYNDNHKMVGIHAQKSIKEITDAEAKKAVRKAIENGDTNLIKLYEDPNNKYHDYYVSLRRDKNNGTKTVSTDYKKYERSHGTSGSSSSTRSSGFHLIPKSTGGKVAAGAGAAALATLGSMAVAGSKGIGPMATDNAKIARANRLIAKGQVDKANKILDSVKDKSKLVAPQAYAASEAE